MHVPLFYTLPWVMSICKPDPDSRTWIHNLNWISTKISSLLTWATPSTSKNVYQNLCQLSEWSWIQKSDRTTQHHPLDDVTIQHYWINSKSSCLTSPHFHRYSRLGHVPSNETFGNCWNRNFYRPDALSVTLPTTATTMQWKVIQLYWKKTGTSNSCIWQNHGKAPS